MMGVIENERETARTRRTGTLKDDGTKIYNKIGFIPLEHKIERAERKAHPSYTKPHIQYIAESAAGRIARLRKR